MIGMIRSVLCLAIGMFDTSSFAFSQCIPGTDNGKMCITCDSTRYACDTVLLLHEGTYAVHMNNAWYHVRGKDVHFVRNDTNWRYANVFQVSRYLYVHSSDIGGSYTGWYDTKDRYVRMPFENMTWSRLEGCVYGRIDSIWSIISPTNEKRIVRCDSILDATWNTAVVRVGDSVLLVSLDDFVVIDRDLVESEYVGTDAILYRTEQDTAPGQWHLYHFPSRSHSGHIFDTMIVVGDFVVGRLSEYDELLNSRGEVVYETAYGESIEDCNGERMVIRRDRRGESYLADMRGERRNSVMLGEVYLGSRGLHIASEYENRSHCVINDDGEIIVPSNKYFSINLAWCRILWGPTALNIFEFDNAEGQHVLVQVSPTGYRELLCGDRVGK